MTFQQLSYLLEVERTGSFSQAAKNLFVTQSTISNTISTLEEELNRRIFVRSAQGLSVTAEGKQILTFARRICENYSLLTSSANFDRPRLCVTCSEYPPARNAFLRILEEYRDRPDVQFSFGIKEKTEYFDSVLLQYADVAITISYSPYDQNNMNTASTKKVMYHKIASLPVGICIGQEHPLYHKEDLKPEDFAGERFLDYPDEHLSHIGAVLAFVPINRENLLLSKNSYLRWDILRKGLAYTVTRIPAKSAQEEGLRYIPIPGLAITVAAYTDPLRPASPLVSRYLELLKEEIRKEL